MLKHSDVMTQMQVVKSVKTIMIKTFPFMLDVNQLECHHCYLNKSQSKYKQCSLLPLQYYIRFHVKSLGRVIMMFPVILIGINPV